VSDTFTFGLLLRKLNLASRGNFSGSFVRWLAAGDDAFRRQGQDLSGWGMIGWFGGNDCQVSWRERLTILSDVESQASTMAVC
jgi:hypothetical protein